MPYLLMKTGGASAEEVDGLVDQLEREGIACYLTDAGRWKLGVAALWLAHDEDVERGREVMAAYQEQFSHEAREHYRAMHARGEAPNFLGHLFRHPVKTVLALAAMVAVLGVSLVPFVRGL